jgi:hypothetical protein
MKNMLLLAAIALTSALVKKQIRTPPQPGIITLNSNSTAPQKPSAPRMAVSITAAAMFTALLFTAGSQMTLPKKATSCCLTACP